MSLNSNTHWREESLENIVTSTAIGLVKGSKEQDSSHKYPYIKMHNISNNNSYNPQKIVKVNATAQEVDKYSLNDGDFLFNTRNSFELVGKSCLYTSRSARKVLFNNNIMRIRFSPEIHNKFIAYAFCSDEILNQLAGMKQGTTSVSAIYYKTLKNLKLKFPSLPEQKRIAALLDSAFADINKARANAEQNLKNARELFESFLESYFSGEVGKSAPKSKISEACESIVDCVNKTAPKVDFETPFKMIRTTNVRNGKVNLEKVNFVTEETFNTWTRRQTPERGDLILTREAPMGEVGILDSDEHVFLGQRLVAYRVNQKKLNNYFLLYAMRSKLVQAQIHARASGSTVQHMRVPDTKLLIIPLPPIAEQLSIVEKLRQAEAYRDQLTDIYSKKLEHLIELKKSLLHKAFTGQLSASTAKAATDGQAA
ncbi:restriction endonuclease subunit S [Zhongshania aliphaticivorans]|jgi:type I restriction enzyme S subunit|uniref:restriction endonuclease subunit S n=1 Tax=Zhongshania aliphaticivorans TaxID=1470434 RepID=UPI0039C9F0DA